AQALPRHGTPPPSSNERIYWRYRGGHYMKIDTRITVRCCNARVDPPMPLFSKTAEMPGPETALRGRAEPIATATNHYLNGRPLKGPYPKGFEMAMFGLGCFWGAERMFWQRVEGAWVTAVGYAGGFTPNPTYEEVCSGRTGHNEVVLVVFDPTKSS